MLNTLAVGVQGVQSGMQRLDNVAQRVAGVGEGEPGNAGDLATQKVEQKLASQQVSASAEVIQTADEMVGSLLDVMA